MRAPLILFFFALISFASPTAFAAGEVIFMLNMNYSSKELKTLKDVAAKRGQTVEMVPPESFVPQVEDLFRQRDELEKKIKALKPEWNKTQVRTLLSEYMRKGLASEKSTDVNQTLSSEIESLHRAAMEVSQLEKRLGPVEDQVRAKISEIKTQGKKIDTMVFSAHSDGSNLSGETSLRLSSSGITRLDREFPEAFKEPRHVLLLGCYNMTETNHFRWRHELFTNATLIAGFGVRAPSRNNPASSNYIREVLTTADSLDGKLANSGPLDPQFVDSVFKKLASVTNTQSVIDYCMQIIEGQPNSRKLSCDEQWKTFRAQSKMFQADYLDLRNMQKDPPRDDQDNELRVFYNTVQSLCPAKDASFIPEKQKAQAERYRTSVEESVIRLIYWWDVQKNFSSYFKKEIDALNAVLPKVGIKKKMPNLDGEVGRIEFIQSYNAVEKAIRDALWEIEDEKFRLSGSTSTVAERRALEKREKEVQRVEAMFKFYYPLYALEGENTVGDSEKTVEGTLKRGGIPFHWFSTGAVLEERESQ
jgi:hypothetical protein